MNKIHRGRRRNDIDVQVGRRVKFRRMELGLSQQQLGSRLGVSFQQIQKYERGTNRIGAGRLFETAKILGVGIDYFYADVDKLQPGIEPADSSVTQVGEFVTSPEGVSLCRAFLMIKDPGTRRRIIDLLNSLAEK